MNIETVVAWHFLPDDGRLSHGRPFKVVPGKTLRLPAKQAPKLCARGFHASERALDALIYAPGALVCRVTVAGEIVRDADKLVGRERTVLWMADANRTLYEFALWAAEQALGRKEASRSAACAAEFAAVLEGLRAWLRGIDDRQLGAAWGAASAARVAARVAEWAAARGAARGALNAELERRLVELAPRGSGQTDE